MILFLYIVYDIVFVYYIVYTHLSSLLNHLMQDVLCLVAPYPFRLEPLHEFNPLTDFDMTGGDDMWYARPQLFFSCTLCPTGQMGDKG